MIRNAMPGSHALCSRTETLNQINMCASAPSTAVRKVDFQLIWEVLEGLNAVDKESKLSIHKIMSL